jgi:ABC-type polysaccharide/polyol phosphate transport system ATPase subunit
MGNIAIRVTGLSKRYNIAASRSQRTTLRDSFGAQLRGLRNLPHKLREAWKNGEADPNFIWALKDVSFEIPKGQVIGIVGNNGAGKSTLLKILAHITEPDEGRVEIFGRMNCLLEVGTGFHPELTGRENVILSGTILGMSRSDIARQFDTIVGFAGVQKFIDTPVKRYSSGMYMRLAFSVAVHLLSDILIVDEVLSVGDAQFQRMGLAKLIEATERGCTVLFVSHNLPIVRELSNRIYLLHEGRIRAHGDPASVLNTYYTLMTAAGSIQTAPRPADLVPATPARHVPAGKTAITRWWIGDDRDDPQYVCYTGQSTTIGFEISVAKTIKDAVFACSLLTVDGKMVWIERSIKNLQGEADEANSANRQVITTEDGHTMSLEPGLHRVECVLTDLPLQAGSYQVRLFLGSLSEGIFDDWLAEPPLRVNRVDDSTFPPAGLISLECEFRVSSGQADKQTTSP